MRGLWAQAPRPRLRCSGSHHLSAGDSFTATLVRKTTTRPPRRRPTFAEHVFTVLLTPVLAAALFVDTSWKAKQRREWDAKLAAINDEINQIKERELRLRSSIQLRNIHHGVYQQQRGYATAAYATVEVENDEIPGEIEMPSWEEEDSSGEHDGFGDDKSSIRQVLSPKEFSPEQLAIFQRYHRLNAITLALRMLLHLRIGSNSFYTITGEDDPVDVANLESLDMSSAVSLPTDTDRLVQMLARTRKQMLPLRRAEDLFLAAPHIQAAANRSTLRQTIQQLTTEFDSGNVSLPVLIEGYGKALMQSKDAPCVSVYVMLIRSLSKIGSSSLAYHAAAALKSSTLPLSDPAIFYMLLQIGRACDSRSLNNLLHFIANTENPMNLIHRWEKTRINGLDLPVPTALNPRLLMALVYVSLRCAQPERAEAWLSLLKEADYGSMWKDDVFRSFLAYHSHHGHWDEGKKWLQRSVNHALSIANQSIDRLARVIYRMLDLCVRCRKLSEYTAILDAAVDSGIGPPLIDKSQNDHRTFHPRTRSILLEWEGLPLPDNADDCSVENKARSFQYACKSLLEELSQKPQARHARHESEDGLALMASTPSEPSQRFATRGRRQLPAGFNNITTRTAEEFNELQSKVADQESLIAEMKARFDLSVRRQKSYEEEAGARTQKWIQSANKLGEEVQETLQRFQRLKAGSTNQEAALQELQLRTTLSAQRQEEEVERAQRQNDYTVQMTGELQELKERFEKLQTLNEMHESERARTHQKIIGLKAVVQSLVEQPRTPQVEVQRNERTKRAPRKDICQVVKKGSTEKKQPPFSTQLQSSAGTKPVLPKSSGIPAEKQEPSEAISISLQQNPAFRKFTWPPEPKERAPKTSQPSSKPSPTPFKPSSLFYRRQKSTPFLRLTQVHEHGASETAATSVHSHSTAATEHVITKIFRRDAESEDGQLLLNAMGEQLRKGKRGRGRIKFGVGVDGPEKLPGSTKHVL